MLLQYPNELNYSLSYSPTCTNLKNYKPKRTLNVCTLLLLTLLTIYRFFLKMKEKRLLKSTLRSDFSNF